MGPGRLGLSVSLAEDLRADVIRVSPPSPTTAAAGKNDVVSWGALRIGDVIWSMDGRFIRDEQGLDRKRVLIVLRRIPIKDKGDDKDGKASVLTSEKALGRSRGRGMAKRQQGKRAKKAVLCFIFRTLALWSPTSRQSQHWRRPSMVKRCQRSGGQPTRSQEPRATRAILMVFFLGGKRLLGTRPPLTRDFRAILSTIPTR